MTTYTHLIDAAVAFWLLDGGNLDRLPNFLSTVTDTDMLPAAIAADPLYQETIAEWQAEGEDEDYLPVFLAAYLQERAVPADQLALIDTTR